MITLEHVQTFKLFGGNIDGWARMKKPGDTMTDKIWTEIEMILQKLHLINKGVAAGGLRTQTFESLKRVSENEDVEQALISLSKR
ncbi:MAG TPA: hypothetical protein VGB71_12510 [Flavisolibacter sp.]|jgi:hypothetical protein